MSADYNRSRHPTRLLFFNTRQWVNEFGSLEEKEDWELKGERKKMIIMLNNLLVDKITYIYYIYG